MNMIDYKPVDTDHITGKEFVALARLILAKYETNHYEDDWMEIRENYNGLALQIRRKAQPGATDHLRVDNPVTMIDHDGDILRHHGEQIYLTTHMREVATALYCDPDASMAIAACKERMLNRSR